MTTWLLRLRRRFWPMPMSLVMAGSFGLLTGLSVAIVLYLSIKTTYVNTFSLLNDKSVLWVQSLQDGIRGHLDPAKQAILEIKREYDSGRLDLSNDTDVTALLKGALTASPAVDAWIVYDPDFLQRGVARKEGEGFEVFIDQPEDEERVQLLLSEMAPDDSVIWSPLVHTEFGVYTAAVAPLTRDGRIDYYLVAAIPTAFLSGLVEQIGRAHEATAFIMEWPFNVVAHSDGERLNLANLRSVERPGVPVSIAGDDVLRLLPFTEVRETFEAANQQGADVRAVDAGGVPYIAILGTLEGYGPNPWTTGIYFERDQVGTEVQRIIGLAIAGVVALILSVIFAVWLSRRIAAPITRTTDRFRRIAGLDLEAVTELPHSSIREMDDGARAFNAMLNGLRAFTSYVPRSLARKLIRLGLEDAGRSREAELTVLFTDIAGFTEISERLPASETVRLLNRHFEILVACIEAEDGTVDKYLGDGLLAFWNAPNEKNDHADSAVRAAVAIRAAVEADNRRLKAEGRLPVRMRIGVHTGAVIVGNIGALDRVNYTIVGDTVNLCQRLQGLGKQETPDEEVAILLSESTWSRLTDVYPGRQLGEHFVKGRSAGVQVWAVDHVGSETAASTDAADRDARAEDAAAIADPVSGTS